jgi:hypothetical protein
MEPPPKKSSFAILGVSSWCVCGAAYPLCGFCSFFVPKHNVWFLDDRSHTSGALIVHRSVSCQVCPSRLSLVEPSARIMGDLVEVALGSPPSLVINVEAGFPGPSQLDTTSATELTMEDYQEPTGVGGDYHR